MTGGSPICSAICSRKLRPVPATRSTPIFHSQIQMPKSPCSPTSTHKHTAHIDSPRGCSPCGYATIWHVATTRLVGCHPCFVRLSLSRTQSCSSCFWNACVRQSAEQPQDALATCTEWLAPLHDWTDLVSYDATSIDLAVFDNSRVLPGLFRVAFEKKTEAFSFVRLSPSPVCLHSSLVRSNFHLLLSVRSIVFTLALRSDGMNAQALSYSIGIHVVPCGAGACVSPSSLSGGL